MRARAYLITAGTEAHKCGALVEVVTYLSDAFEIPSLKNKLSNAERVEEGRVRVLLGESYYSLGMFDEALPHLFLALDCFGAKLPRGRLKQGSLAIKFLMESKLSRIFNSRRRLPVAAPKSRRSVVSPAASESSKSILAEVRRDTSIAFSCVSQIMMLTPAAYSGIEILCGVLKMKEEAEQSNFFGIQALSHCFLSVLSCSIDLRTASYHLQLTSDIAQQHPDVTLCLASHSYASMFVEATNGDFEGALDSAEAGEKRFTKCGDFRRSRELAGIRCGIMNLVGNFDQAELMSRSVIEICASSRDDGAKASTLNM